MDYPNKLSLDQQSDLENDISKEEIKQAEDCGSDKSPGLDGFTFDFYRRYWNVIEKDVVEAVTSFFQLGSFPKGCNASFIALIPKKQDAKMVKDFRPFQECLLHLMPSVLQKNKWYRTQLYEMHLLLNPSQREELENELTSREELAVLQVEFADMEGRM
ncbi:hypothetical protein Tco_1454343 [Tanacetum coccineum]